MSVCRASSLPLFRQVRRRYWISRCLVAVVAASSFNGLYHLRGRSLANSLRFHKVTGTRKAMRLWCCTRSWLIYIAFAWMINLPASGRVRLQTFRCKFISRIFYVHITYWYGNFKRWNLRYLNWLMMHLSFPYFSLISGACSENRSFEALKFVSNF